MFQLIISLTLTNGTEILSELQGCACKELKKYKKNPKTITKWISLYHMVSILTDRLIIGLIDIYSILQLQKEKKKIINF